MAFVHGKNTVVTVGGSDLSAFANTSEFTRGADSNDATTYGKDDHVFTGGLRTGGFTIGGIYDNTASTGPAAVLEPLIGTVVALTRQPEGTGAGLPEQSFSGLLTSYVESSPVADNVTWSAEFTVSDAVTTAAQV